MYVIEYSLTNKITEIEDYFKSNHFLIETIQQNYSSNKKIAELCDSILVQLGVIVKKSQVNKEDLRSRFIKKKEDPIQSQAFNQNQNFITQDDIFGIDLSSKDHTENKDQEDKDKKSKFGFINKDKKDQEKNSIDIFNFDLTENKDKTININQTSNINITVVTGDQKTKGFGFVKKDKKKDDLVDSLSGLNLNTGSQQSTKMIDINELLNSVYEEKDNNQGIGSGHNHSLSHGNLNLQTYSGVNSSNPIPNLNSMNNLNNMNSLNNMNMMYGYNYPYNNMNNVNNMNTMNNLSYQGGNFYPNYPTQYTQYPNQINSNYNQNNQFTQMPIQGGFYNKSMLELNKDKEEPTKKKDNAFAFIDDLMKNN